MIKLNTGQHAKSEVSIGYLSYIMESNADTIDNDKTLTFVVKAVFNI